MEWNVVVSWSANVYPISCDSGVSLAWDLIKAWQDRRWKPLIIQVCRSMRNLSPSLFTSSFTWNPYEDLTGRCMDLKVTLGSTNALHSCEMGGPSPRPATNHAGPAQSWLHDYLISTASFRATMALCPNPQSGPVVFEQFDSADDVGSSIGAASV